METIKVYNPSTGNLIDECANLSEQEVKIAVDRTVNAFPSWSKKIAAERSALLRQWHDLIKADKEVFAKLLTAENGKCLSESRGEIDYGLGFIEWYAEEAKRLYGDTIPTHDPNGAVIVTKNPIGPTAAITPWNFPFMMITRKIATALAAGCTMIIKPAEDTPLTAIKLLAYARKAGIPEGVFELVTGDPKMIGQIFTADARIRKISFTGSTQIGKLLVEQSASTLKKLTMELGGNAPFIIFDDANIENAVKGLVSAKLRNSGQVCISPNRIYVQQTCYAQVIALLKDSVSQIRVDDGLQEEFVVGPLINQKAIDKVEALISTTITQGAKVIYGGKVHEKGGLFYEPTILTALTDDMDISQTEIFGPVFAIYTFESEQEVIARANHTPYGLVAYAYTENLGRAFRLSQRIESGMVILNSGSVGTASVPFGGIKESGYGREGSYYGIEEYVEVKYTLFSGLKLQ
ncbi:NAD-dependent succinate-semialdehyde dehydrogenase [Pedobacter sp. UYP1]|uniref:NAD-dependent succinate-semialdehyde dehydrogenase n=1 Tax=Pedobacter sp. UYP1 TaxID=1756396 RepID=UPI00339268B1